MPLDNHPNPLVATSGFLFFSFFLEKRKLGWQVLRKIGRLGSRWNVSRRKHVITYSLDNRILGEWELLSQRVGGPHHTIKFSFCLFPTTSYTLLALLHYFPLLFLLAMETNYCSKLSSTALCWSFFLLFASFNVSTAPTNSIPPRYCATALFPSPILSLDLLSNFLEKKNEKWLI